MNEAAVKVLKENPWNLATMSDLPNVVPVGFKEVTDDGKLIIGNIMMETTVRNIQENGKAAVSAYDPKTSEGYQVKGNAVYVTEGPVYEACCAKAEAVFHGAVVVKGVVVITPETVIVTTPGPDNKKVL